MRKHDLVGSRTDKTATNVKVKLFLLIFWWVQILVMTLVSLSEMLQAYRCFSSPRGINAMLEVDMCLKKPSEQHDSLGCILPRELRKITSNVFGLMTRALLKEHIDALL